MEDFNSSEQHWKEIVASFITLVATIVLGVLIRFIAAKVLEADLQSNLLKKKDDPDYTAMVGDHRLLSLLGVPHVVRSRSKVSFYTILIAAFASSFGAFAISAFEQSSELKRGDRVDTVTFGIGDSVMDEGRLMEVADLLRRSGAVSFCCKRAGQTRSFYQPHVQTSATFGVYCEKLMHSDLGYEADGFLEEQAPDSLISIKDLEGVTTVTNGSNYQVHRAVLHGLEFKAVCNQGMFYRGVRSGLISQSCAFATKTKFILGGYALKDAGPGALVTQPTKDNIRYYDSFTIELGSELSEGQLMQAVTLWDLGSMSEVEVAVLAKVVPLHAREGIYSGGKVGFQLNLVGFSIGMGITLIAILLGVLYLGYDSFKRRDGDRLGCAVSTLEGVSRIMKNEAQRNPQNNSSRTVKGSGNEIAIRRIKVGDDGPDKFHVGSACLGEPVEPGTPNIVVKNNLW